MTTQPTHGVVNHADSPRKTDYLYRISLKGFIQDDQGRVLVVKESGRADKWDLPGGGMDHGESVRTTLAREMFEEVMLQGDFEYQILDADEPRHIDSHYWWQMRLVYRITPTNMQFAPGEDGDEVAFMDPNQFKDSEYFAERKIYHYAQVAAKCNPGAAL